MRSDHFKDMLTKVGQFGVAYKPPNVNQVRTSLLAEVKGQVEQDLQGAFFDCIGETGATVASDGWSSTDSRPLLNLLLASPKGACFLKAVDTSGDAKVSKQLLPGLCSSLSSVCCTAVLATAHLPDQHMWVQDAGYIAEVVSDAIEQAGPEKVVQVVMDNAAACRSAGKELEDR